MGFVVLPATIPDIRKVYDVYFAAFKGEAVTEILFPWDVKDEAFMQGHASHTLDYWHKDKFQYTFKCIDTETDEIVGMALWDVHWKHRSKDERKKPAVDWLQGQQKERAEGFIFPLWDRKEQLLGGIPHVYCHVIAVHPQYQRKGIGTFLTQWGVHVGDSLGAPVYLEATESSAPLYQKLGFDKMSQGVVLKAGIVGDDEVEAPVMVKMPTSAAGMSFEGWACRGYTDFTKRN